MSDAPDRRIAEAAKKTVSLRVRVSRAEALEVERRARDHDPPTVAAWLRDLIAEDLGDKKRKGAT